MPVMREPLVTKLNSGDLGWVWGVLKPHGPRKPAVIEISFPIVAGIVSELAEEEKPAAPVVLAGISFTKSNLKAASGRIAILEISVGRSKSSEMS
jgi:hypothetical protein